MTTVAYRDGIIAADMQAGNGNRAARFHKIGRNKGGSLIGGCGDAPLVYALIRWFVEDGDKMPPTYGKFGDDECDVHAFIIRPDRRLYRIEPAGTFEFFAEYAAMGSGGAYALGAFAAGVDARTAVQCAAIHDVHTGMGVEQIELGVLDDPFPKF